jgi:hypothetical protein
MVIHQYSITILLVNMSNWDNALLLANSERFKCLADEIKRIYPDPSTCIPYKDIMSILYLDVVLRVNAYSIHCSFWYALCYAKNGAVLGGYFIHRGVSIITL